MKAFSNARIFDGERFADSSVLLVDGERVERLTDDIPENSEVINCKDCYLVPGMIDLQIYGGGGHVFASSLNASTLHIIADDLVSKGTAGFFITFATNSFDVYRKAVDIVKTNPHPAVLGIHLEGPYINPVKKGAHVERYIKKSDRKELKDLLDRGEGTIKMMTLAPEMCDDTTLDLLFEYNVLVSAGHSNATYEEAMHGFDYGIPAVTHLFNAMSSFHHRQTGLPGATFLTERAMASIIPDGIHVNFEAAEIAKRIMGKRLYFITDAVDETTEGDYVYIRKKDRYVLPDGTLAGSALTMPLAVKNGVQKIDIPLEESLRMATLYPSQLANLNNCGKIKTGWEANFVCLDKDLNLKFTVFQGKRIEADIAPK